MRVPVIWAGLIAIQLALTFAFDADTTTRLLFGWLVLGALLTTALAVRRHGRRVRETSGPALLLAVAIVALALGAELGMWLLLIGAGLAVIALAGLVTE
jgi:hypothetical protein